MKNQKNIDIIGNYKSHAQIWDIDMWDRSAEIDFFSHIANKYGKNILYLMCATGGFAKSLSDKGFSITAVDREAKMINIAEARHSDNKNLSFICQDICELNLIKKDYDFCFSMDMAHLIAKENRQKAFKSISAHLRIGGGLCLPIKFPNKDSYKVGPERFDYEINTSKTQDIISVYKIGITEYEASSMVTKISQDVFIENKKGKESFHHEFLLKDFTSYEINNLLTDNKFSIANRYSDYEMNQCDNQNFCIIEAVKTE